MSRTDVLAEFSRGSVTQYHDTHAMADEIVRLREQLAGVTVTGAMVEAAFVRLYPGCFPEEMQRYHADDIRAALTAAITAASERREEGNG